MHSSSLMSLLSPLNFLVNFNWKTREDITVWQEMTSANELRFSRISNYSSCLLFKHSRSSGKIWNEWKTHSSCFWNQSWLPWRVKKGFTGETKKSKQDELLAPLMSLFLLKIFSRTFLLPLHVLCFFFFFAHLLISKRDVVVDPVFTLLLLCMRLTHNISFLFSSPPLFISCIRWVIPPSVSPSKNF